MEKFEQRALRDGHTVERLRPARGTKPPAVTRLGLWWAFFGAVSCLGAGLTVMAIGEMFMYGGDRVTGIMGAIGLAMFVGGIAGIYGLNRAMEVWQSHSTEAVIVEPKPQRDEPQKYRPMVSTSPGTLTIGDFSVTRRQWLELGSSIHANGGRLAREKLPPRIIDNVTVNYPKLVGELQRMELIDGDNYLTDAGRLEWHSPTSAYSTMGTAQETDGL